ncbi:hypothetical protein GCM10027039_24420 [Terrabacter koreensis]
MLWSTTTAGSKYESIVAPASANTKKMLRLIDANNLPGLRKACKEQIALDDLAMRSLNAGLWPTKVQPYIDKVIDNLAARRDFWKDCTKVASVREWNDLPDMPNPNAGASQRVRVMLGLSGTN